jgi:hypothetical protein
MRYYLTASLPDGRQSNGRLRHVTRGNGGYKVQATFLGAKLYLGFEKTPAAAGLLADSAIFYLWGFMKNPKPEFNFYRPDSADPTPESLPEIETIRGLMIQRAKAFGLDPAHYSFTFAQRHDFPRPDFYP